MDLHRIAATTALMAAIVGGISSCSKKGEEPSATAKPSSGAKRAVPVKGSDTMVHLVSLWAEAFMKTQPDIEISVTGGGSGTGIAALINGTTDLCAASREINDKEKQLAKEKGILPTEFTVARDGIAVVVNPKNPVNELTLEQLRKIFTGAYTKWSQVGGPDENIIVLSRESSSGTYVFFQEHVLNKEDYTQKARLMPATSAIVQATASDKPAIGYVGLGYAAEAKGTVKVLQVKKDAASPAIVPSEETVKAATYPIARALYFYANSAPTGAVKDFLDFCQSPAGEKIVRDAGFVTVK